MTPCGADALERRQVADHLALEVHRVDVPVLVAADVLQVEQVLAVLGPEVDADAAVGVVGDLGVVGLADRPHPHVEHALVGRCQVRQARPVRRDARGGLLGVADQHLARDQRRELRERGRGEAKGQRHYDEELRLRFPHYCLLCACSPPGGGGNVGRIGEIRFLHSHSYLSASIGSRRAALYAG